MAKVTIYGAPRSSYTWAVRAAANAKGVDHEHVDAMPHSAEVDAIHPLGRIPVMRHGDVTVAESAAIASYLDAAFDGPALFPREPAARARVDQWVSLVNTAVDPACIRGYVLESMAPDIFNRPTDQAKRADALERMPALFDALESGLTEAGYLGSDSPTYADFNVTPPLFYSGMLPEGRAMLAERPRLKAYVDRMSAHPAIAAAAPAVPA